MNIKKLTIYQIKEKVISDYPIDKDGLISIEDRIPGQRKDPFWKCDIELENISDSIIIIYPNNVDFPFFLSFWYQNHKYTNKYNTLCIENQLSNFIKEIRLFPKQKLSLTSSGYFIDRSSTFFLKTLKIKDYSNILIEILPTIRFYYKDNEITINSENIYNVEIKEEIEPECNSK